MLPSANGRISSDNRVRPTPFFKRGGFHAGQSAGFPAAYGQRWSGTAIGGLVGLGVTLAPAMARAQELRIKDAKTTPSICPFCSVGCATLIHTVDGKIVNIEGDPRSPHNEGTLCPKGAAIYQLHLNPNRATKVLHRKPGAKDGRSWSSSGPWTAWPS